MTHTGEKPLSCDKGFLRRWSFKQHMKFHGFYPDESPSPVMIRRGSSEVSGKVGTAMVDKKVQIIICDSTETVDSDNC